MNGLGRSDRYGWIYTYVRYIDWTFVVVITGSLVFLGGVGVLIYSDIVRENTFKAQCSAEGGWVASVNPLICLSDDGRVIRIQQ